MDEVITVTNLEWQAAIAWFEEKKNNHRLCDWQRSSTGTNIFCNQLQKVIAYKTDIPTRYFLLKKYFKDSPWGKRAK